MHRHPSWALAMWEEHRERLRTVLGDEALGSSACASGERTRAHPQESVQVQFADLALTSGPRWTRLATVPWPKNRAGRPLTLVGLRERARLWSIDDFFDRMLGCAV